MDIVQARWSSSSFLLYAGGLVILFAVAALLGTIGDEYSEGAFFGWSALVFGVLAVVTLGFEAVGHRLVAGLFALISLVSFSVFVGAFEDLIGILDAGDSPFEGFRWGFLLLQLVIITTALILLARFHFPLLVLPVAATSWFFVVDLVSGGGDWSAIVSIIVGFFMLLVGAGMDRIYGFWVHVVAGLAVGGGFLYLWHSADWEWIMIGIIALIYFLLAGGLDRSSYAVLGAIGLFLAWSHFVEDWTGEGAPNPVFGTGSIGNSVLQAVLYAVYGFALLVVGLWLERRQPVAAPELPAT